MKTYMEMLATMLFPLQVGVGSVGAEDTYETYCLLWSVCLTLYSILKPRLERPELTAKVGLSYRAAGPQARSTPLP